MHAQSFLAYGRLDRFERVGSVMIGGPVALAGVAMLGFTHRIGTAMALIAVGTALVARGTTGVALVRALRHRRASEEPIDAIDRESMESFPASDAPSRHSFN